MPNPEGGGQALKRGEGTILLELLHVGADPEDSGSVLPPGKRDASGFWYPARCATPKELFTPYQRSLQEKQRTVHRERRHRRGRGTPDAIPVPCDQAVPLPPPQPEAPAK
jgi:hypothetical protein